MQLLLAASMWTLVGFGLLGFGLKWLIGSESKWILLLLLGSVIVGGIKGKFILNKTAMRTINRVQSRGDGTCIFGVFSIWSWLFVVMMIALGNILRMSGLSDDILGAIYSAVGVALIIGSVFTWNAFINLKV